MFNSSKKPPHHKRKDHLKHNKNQSKAFIRGGQLFMYNARMWAQVANRITFWSMIQYLIVVVAFMVLFTQWHDIEIIMMWWYCHILSFFGLGDIHAWTNPLYPTQYFTADGHLNDVSSQIYYATALNKFIMHLIVSLFMGLILYLSLNYLWTRLFIRLGNKHTDDQFISGTVLAKNVKQTIKSVDRSPKGASDIRLLSVLPLPRFSEFQGIMFHGSIGSGKSQAMMRLLDDIKQSGDPAIIYDKECVLKPYYFDATKDVELNPLSTLCQNWDIWAECLTPIEMGALATYMMPKSVQGSDPFWVDAARSIFATTAWEMRTHEDKSIIKLLQVILTTSLDDFRRILEKTEAENLVSKDIEKTAISIRAVMATYTKALRFLEGLDKKDDKGHYLNAPFSIRQWVKAQYQSQDTHKGWLFITSRANVHSEIKPLISAWIGMAMKGIQNLPANNHRRFWVVMDEFSSLNRLEDFVDTTADIRKFGGCVAIGIQSISQIQSIYGRDEATAMTDLMNTAVYSRSPKEHVANWVSKDLGEQIIEEVKESQSYGPNAIRDGNTISRQRVTRRTVDTGTIMTMNDLEFYIRLVGSHPITHMTAEYVTDRQPLLEQALEERVIDWDAIKKIAIAAAEAENHPDNLHAIETAKEATEETEANHQVIVSDSETANENSAHDVEVNGSTIIENQERKF